METKNNSQKKSLTHYFIPKDGSWKNVMSGEVLR